MSNKDFECSDVDVNLKKVLFDFLNVDIFEVRIVDDKGIIWVINDLN